MSNEEIRQRLAVSTDFHYDESPVIGVEPSLLDLHKIKEVSKQVDVENPGSDLNQAILLDNKILVGDINNPQITVAGWLCFAQNPQSHRAFKNAYIEFQVFNGTTRANPVKTQIVSGTLPSQINEAIVLLNQHQWTMPEIKGAKRKDIPAYSEDAFREVVTNSVVHRDYKKMHQPVKIAVFTDRIEIENPGGLLPGLTTFNLIHKRDWRNPLLAELMKKFGYGDMDGQGIDRLYAVTGRIKVPGPRFVDDDSSFKAILSGPKEFEEFSVEEKRITVIILLIIENTIDNESVRNAFGISNEKAGTLIKSMLGEKIIFQINSSRKYAKYELTPTWKEKIYGA